MCKQSVECMQRIFNEFVICFGYHDVLDVYSGSIRDERQPKQCLGARKSHKLLSVKENPPKNCAIGKHQIGGGGAKSTRISPVYIRFCSAICVGYRTTYLTVKGSWNKKLKKLSIEPCCCWFLFSAIWGKGRNRFLYSPIIPCFNCQIDSFEP